MRNIITTLHPKFKEKNCLHTSFVKQQLTPDLLQPGPACFSRGKAHTMVSKKLGKLTNHYAGQLLCCDRTIMRFPIPR